MIPLTKTDREKLHSDLENNLSEMKSMNEHIAAMLEELHDKSDKKIEKQIQPMSVQIKDISSRQSENIQNEVLIITSDHPSSEYNIERKFQDNISPSNQIPGNSSDQHSST